MNALEKQKHHFALEYTVASTVACQGLNFFSKRPSQLRCMERSRTGKKVAEMGPGENEKHDAHASGIHDEGL
jgi:hypothetical protein